VNHTAEYEAFSALLGRTSRVQYRRMLPRSSAAVCLFCFVRRQADSSEVVEAGPYWSRFQIVAVLAEMREKLRRIFGIDLIVRDAGVTHLAAPYATVC
jgi:hypothetical protein